MLRVESVPDNVLWMLHTAQTHSHLTSLKAFIMYLHRLRVFGDCDDGSSPFLVHILWVYHLRIVQTSSLLHNFLLNMFFLIIISVNCGLFVWIVSIEPILCIACYTNRILVGPAQWQIHITRFTLCGLCVISAVERIRIQLLWAYNSIPR